MSLMDVSTKLDMALLVLTVSELPLWPQGKWLYWLCNVSVWSEAVCTAFILWYFCIRSRLIIQYYIG